MPVIATKVRRTGTSIVHALCGLNHLNIADSMSIDIPSEFVPWVQNAVASGSYKSESAVIGEAIRLLQQRDERLRQEVAAGFDEIGRGEYVKFDDATMHQYLQSIPRRALEELGLEKPEINDDDVLRAVREGFDQIDRGECYEINGPEELRKFLEGIEREVFAELEAKKNRPRSPIR